MLHVLTWRARLTLRVNLTHRRYAQSFGLLPKDVINNARNELAKRAPAADPAVVNADSDETRHAARIADEAADALKRKRRTDWKRRQGVSERAIYS